MTKAQIDKIIDLLSEMLTKENLMAGIDRETVQAILGNPVAIREFLLKARLAFQSVIPESTLQSSEISNYLMKFHKAELVAISDGCSKVELGQIVTANGRSFNIPEGTKGIVVKIAEPFTYGRTNDIIDVKFVDELCPISMKFEDLDLK